MLISLLDFRCHPCIGALAPRLIELTGKSMPVGPGSAYRRNPYLIRQKA